MKIVGVKISSGSCLCEIIANKQAQANALYSSINISTDSSLGLGFLERKQTTCTILPITHLHHSESLLVAYGSIQALPALLRGL